MRLKNSILARLTIVVLTVLLVVPNSFTFAEDVYTDRSASNAAAEETVNDSADQPDKAAVQDGTEAVTEKQQTDEGSQDADKDAAEEDASKDEGASDESESTSDENTDVNAGEPSGDQKDDSASSETKDAVITLKLISASSGSPLTDDQIGSGFTFTYFMYPASLDLDGKTHEEVMAILKDYKHEVKVREQGQELTIRKPSDASASDKYFIRGGIHSEEDADKGYSMDMWDGAFYAVFGDSLETEGITDEGKAIKKENQIKEDTEGNKYFEFVKYEGFDKTPVIKVNVKGGADDDFPVYLKTQVTADMTPDTAEDTVQKKEYTDKVTENGQTEIKLSGMPFYSTEAEYSIKVSVYKDEDCTEKLDSWYSKNPLLDKDITFDSSEKPSEDLSAELLKEKESKDSTAARKAPAKAPGVEVTPILSIQADFPGVSQGEDLPADRKFSVHWTISDSESSYRFDHAINKSYQDFRASYNHPTGDYTIKMEMGETGAVSQWSVEGDSVVNVTLKEDGRFYYADSDEPFVARYTNNKVLKVKLHSTDKKNNVMTSDQLAGKGYSVRYAFIPEDTEFPDPEDYYGNVHNQEEADAAAAAYRAAMQAFYAQYTQTVVLNNQDQVLEIAIPSDASDSKVYHLLMAPTEEFMAMPPYILAQIAEVFYYGVGTAGDEFVWDTGATMPADYRQYYTLVPGDEISTLGVKIDTERTTVKPKVEVHTSAPEGKYPIYVDATIRRADGGQSIEAKAAINESGVTDITFDQEELAQSVIPYYLEWRITDENYENETDEEFDATSGTATLYLDKDGSLKIMDNYDTGELSPYYIDIAYSFVDDLSVPMHTTLDGDYNESDYFPVYLKAELYDNNDSSNKRTVVKKIESLEDANEPIVFEGPFKVTNQSKTLRWSFYNDEDCTQTHDNWQPGSAVCNIQGSTYCLAYTNGSGSYYEPDGMRVSLIYNRVRIPVSTETKNAPDDIYPRYIDVSASTNKSGFSKTVHKTAKFTEDSSKTVYLDYLAQRGTDVNFNNSMMYEDEGTTVPDTSWNMSGVDSSGVTGTTDAEGTVYYRTSSWNYQTGTYTYDTKAQKIKYSWKGIEPKFDVKVTVDPDDESYAFGRYSYYHIDLFKKELVDGNVHNVFKGKWYSTTNNFRASENREQEVSLSTAVTPGKYILYYYSSDSSWAGGSSYSNKNDAYTSSPEDGINVEVLADGSVVDENGEPINVEFIYTRSAEDTSSYVRPHVKINTTMQYSGSYRERIYVQFAGVDGTNTEGIVSSDDTITTQEALGVHDFCKQYSNSNNNLFYYKKIPPGEYDLSYYTFKRSNATYTFDLANASDIWTIGDKIRVTVDEEGLIKVDGTEYILPNNMAPAVDSVKVKLDTIVRDGVKNAFTDGDTVEVKLVLKNFPYGVGYQYITVAEGIATITEKGISEVTLTPSKDKYGNDMKIYLGDGYNSPYGLENAPYGSDNYRYYISVVTRHEDGTVNNLWSYRNQPFAGGGWDSISDALDVYVNEDGTLTDGQDPKGEEKSIPNISYLMPWDETPDPDAISQASDGDIVFKPITNVKQIQDKQHYMVVVQNRYDGKWYALSYDDGKGDQVLLEDVNSLEDLENGYVRKESDLSSTPYIFTAGKVTQADGSVNFQFKTGLKENNKNIAIKMGASAKEYLPIFTNSAGNITAIKTGDNGNSGVFTINKNNYTVLAYVDEYYGQRGFTAISSDYSRMPVLRTEYGDPYDSEDTNMYYFDEYSNYNYPYTVRDLNEQPDWDDRYFGKKPQNNIWDWVYEADDKYLNEEYYQSLVEKLGNQGGYGISPYNRNVYILSDTQVDEDAGAENNNYKLVKTFGDFNNTFLANEANNKSFVMVYTDKDGKEYALNPKGLVEVRTTEGAAEYKTVTCGVNNEVIPNNNSRNSQGETSFNFMITDTEGDGSQVAASYYSFRKSRANTYANGEYLTLNGNAWGANDSTSVNYTAQTYALVPTASVRNEVDWDKPTSYKLSVNRNGRTLWLGIEENSSGKLEMTVVDSEEDAVVFDIYAPNMERYYTDFMSDEYGTYYKIDSLNDIGEDDQILVVYNDNGKRSILAATTPDSAVQRSSDGGYGYSNYVFPMIYVSDEDVPIDTDDDDAVFPEGFRYYYNLASEDAVKHVYAYTAKDDGSVIIAQGVAANIIGGEKSIKPTQEKYDALTGLGNTTQNKLWLKDDGYPIYRSKSEVNFYFEGGQFYLRGGKDIYWLGLGTYEKPIYKPYNDSSYYYYGDAIDSEEHDMFKTVGKDDRVPVEIYKKGNSETITVNYHDVNDLDGEPLRSEVKPEGLVGLAQDDDVVHGGEDYIFVGWTKDKSKAGYLSKKDSANLYDFDDTSRKGSVTDATREKYGLLGNCDPEKPSSIKVLAKDLEDTDGVLDLYPVYALRGRTEVITADESDGTKVIGIADVKDLEEGSDGTIEARERWLGSVNVEVYKDGELWVPKKPASDSSGGSTTHGLTDAADDDVSATMYFAYHNDDAADVNIKFIADSVTDQMLEEYLRDGDFSATEPTEMYVIDAVFAEQGGSEDGLKYKYNWVDQTLGGQLDNVRGGSTIKVYVTTKYNVKYYFDDDDGNGYEELTDAAHKNDNYYTTAGTENVVTANRDNADYVVIDKDGEENRALIQRTPSNTQKFLDENIRRGSYSFFQYEFDNYNHVIPIAALPEPPAGYVLDSDKWTIRDKSLAELATQAPNTGLTVTETTYGTGNSVWAYKNEGLNDVTHTYHLYIKVQSNNTSISITKKWSDGKDADGIRPSADEFKANIKLYADGDEVTDAVPAITDNGDNTYTITYNNLPRVNGSGAEIEYTVKETEIDGYNAKDNKDEAADGETITNEHTPETTEVEITKQWNDADDQDGIRPAAEDFGALFKLYADGNEVADAVPTVTDNGDGTYTVKYTDLPKYKAGEAIEYTAIEGPFEGYTPEVDGEAGRLVPAGGTIVNNHTTAVVNVQITKKWEDADDHDGLRLTADEYKAAIHLYAGDKEVAGVDPAVTDNGDGTYTVKYTGLPKNEAGEAIVYTVKEDAVEQYTATVDGEESDTVKAGGTIVNTHEPVMINVSITKEWDDASNQDGLRLSAADFASKIHLYADGKEMTDADADVEDNGDGTYTVKFTDLPKYKDGEEIEYTVKEDDIDSYNAYVNGKLSNEAPADGTIVNKHVPSVTSIQITKIWDDANDQDRVRPSVADFTGKLKLLADGNEVIGATPVVTDNGNGTFTVKYENIPEYKNGEKIKYIVKEDSIENYVTTKSEAQNGESITNKHTPGETSIQITKNWDDADNQDAVRPSTEAFADMIHLMRDVDGDITEVLDHVPTVTENSDGSYTASYTGLPEMVDGVPVKYFIKEVPSSEYKVKDGIDTAVDGGSITNVHVPEETEVEITKAWDDADDQDGYRLTAEEFAAKVHLYAGDTEVTDAEPEVTENDDGTYKVKYTGLPKNKAGHAIVYTVKEDSIDHYTSTVEGEETDTVPAGGTIVNKHEPEKTKIDVTKKWDDMNDVDQIRPDVIEVDLMKKVGDGDPEKVKTLEVKASEDWKGSFENLPVYYNRQKIEYSIKEVSVDDYTTEIKGSPKEGYTITNTHIPMGDLKIEKSLPVYNTDSEGYFVYSIIAEKDGKKVYEGIEEIRFEEAGEKSVTIEGKIPVGAKVTVTEIYTGAGYELNTEKTVTVTILGTKQDGSPATASFENTYDDSMTSGGGVTNEFTYNGEDWEHNKGGASK